MKRERLAKMMTLLVVIFEIITTVFFVYSVTSFNVLMPFWFVLLCQLPILIWGVILFAIYEEEMT